MTAIVAIYSPRLEFGVMATDGLGSAGDYIASSTAPKLQIRNGLCVGFSGNKCMIDFVRGSTMKLDGREVGMFSGTAEQAARAGVLLSLQCKKEYGEVARNWSFAAVICSKGGIWHTSDEGFFAINHTALSGFVISGEGAGGDIAMGGAAMYLSTAMPKRSPDNYSDDSDDIRAAMTGAVQNGIIIAAPFFKNVGGYSYWGSTEHDEIEKHSVL